MNNDETKLVKERYQRRISPNLDERYIMLNPSVWKSHHERQEAIIKTLKNYINMPLDKTKLLEIGCGGGGNLLDFIRLGFSASNLTGNELLPERVNIAKENLPDICNIISGDANSLDIKPESYDIVFQSVVFSSLLDKPFQEELSNTMWKWIKPGGGILWYDFIYDNPSNQDVRGVSISRIKELFPAGNINIKRVTLAPPISRKVTKIHPFLYNVFNLFPFLRTHVLCYIEKPQK